ncbi:MAG: RluA family pseudouridine synthase [Dehalococcoidia bacterium]|nr:RluA family pseudouridine synthase [Dehalococcoidia bacterium]
MTNQYLLKAEQDGERLDIFVTRHVPELTRSAAQRLIENGCVTLNGVPTRSGVRPKSGDIVAVEVPPPSAPDGIQPEDIPLKIVYEDADLLVVDKPAGMTVHPAPGSPAHTLANAVLAHLPSISGGDSVRPGIVHRLDKDTSGLIVVAKTPQAHENLAAQFRSRTVKKTYIALVTGRLTPPEGIIDAPVGRDRSHRQKMTVTSRGRSARTAYRVMEYLPGYTLVEARPETGRTHQIRVHFTSIGHPVAGDATYGGNADIVGRQFLHAHRLSFALPSTGKTVEFISELANDLQEALDRLR